VRQKKRGAVRIPVSFGQAEVKIAKKLSEYRSHSDRRRQKKRGTVRIPVSFRQVEDEKERGCQNTGLIQTGGD
jgi:hypothetical protein